MKLIENFDFSVLDMTNWVNLHNDKQPEDDAYDVACTFLKKYNQKVDLMVPTLCQEGWGVVGETKTCQECKAGQWSPSPVEPCDTPPEGFYTDTDGATELKKCAAGTVRNADATGCDTCTKGTYDDGGTCKNCPVGHFMPDDQASACNPCEEG